MKKIGLLVAEIDEELEGAKNYAERYVALKAEGKSSWANTFKDMAGDELKHASNIHAYAVEEINKLNTVFTPPAEMQEMWDKSHKDYVERAAWVKQMLAM